PTSKCDSRPLHDALPISVERMALADVIGQQAMLGHVGMGLAADARAQLGVGREAVQAAQQLLAAAVEQAGPPRDRRRVALAHPPDRKSTRLNSSHDQISY